MATGPLIFADNRLDDGTPAVSSTAAGFSALNLTDWRQFTWWKATALPATITIDCGSAKAADYLLLYGGDFTGCTVTLSGSSDNFATRVDFDAITPTADAHILARFASASYRYWRITIAGTTPPAIAIAAIGTAFELPYGMAAHDPLGRTQEGVRTVNMNGYPLGIVSSHEMQEFNLRFDLVSWADLRDEWATTWAKIKNRPFGFAWDFDGHPNEVNILMGDGRFDSPHQAGDIAQLSIKAAGVPVTFAGSEINLTLDQFISSVILLMHFDGANAATTFTDERGNFTFTNNGAALTTGVNHFGTASLNLESTNSRITSVENVVLSANEPVTIEFFLRLSSAVRQVRVLGSTSDGNTNDIGLYADPTDSSSNAYLAGTTIPYTYAWPTEVFKHVAIVRNSTTATIFIDGVARGSAACTAALNDKITFGSNDPDWSTNGQIDEVRVTKVARYTGTFTPPAAPFVNQ